MATNEEIVAKAQQLYVSYYGRWADPAGLNFWIDKFEASDNVDQVLIDFGTGDEYLDWIADNGLDTSEDVVTALYQQMFNRDPDAEGLAFYVEQLESGALSLASIALDIANGATGDDVTILNNKVDVANVATDDVEDQGKAYSSDDIADAQAALALVDEDEDSVAAGTAAAADVVDGLPEGGPGGEFTLTETDSSADYSARTSSVIVTLDGDADEADFDVKGSAFDDMFILEELGSADIDGFDGIDTINFNEINGDQVVSLLAGSFATDDGASGVLTSIENIIGSDGDDTITGSSDDNEIWAGDGDDTVEMGVGDDNAYFEDEDQLGTGTVDGQSGEDSIVFTADAIDLTAVDATHISVENLVLSDLDDEGEVSLLFGTVSSTYVVIDQFDAIIGSDAVDSLSWSTGTDVDISGVELIDIDVLTMGGSSTDISLTLGADMVPTDISIVGNNKDRLYLDGTGVFDLTGITLSGFDKIENTGQSGHTLIINQHIADSMLEESGNANIDIQNGDETSILTFSGNIDLSGFDNNDSRIHTSAVEFGEATTVIVRDLKNWDGIKTVDGGEGDNDTLVIVDTTISATSYASQDLTGIEAFQNLTGIELGGIENLLIDINSLFEDYWVTIDESSLGDDLKTIAGRINLWIEDNPTAADLTGVVLSDVGDLSSNSTGAFVVVDQGALESFATLGGGLGSRLDDNKLALMMGGNLDLSDMVWGGDDSTDTLIVVGTDDADDSLTMFSTMTTGISLGGDNNVIDVNLGGGNNTYSGSASVLTLTAGTVTGPTDDGTNMVIGAVGIQAVGGAGAELAGVNYDGTVTGGYGSDILIGLFNGDQRLGAGNDSITGIAGKGADGAGAALGSGDDSFTGFSAVWYNNSNGGNGSVVDGGSGDDTLSTSYAGDELTGGSGSDVFSISGKALGVQEVEGLFTLNTMGKSGGGGNPGGGSVGHSLLLVDFNDGERDSLQLNLVGTYTTGIDMTSLNKATTGTTTLTSPLAPALTTEGALAVLTAAGALGVRANGEAVGATVALPVIAEVNMFRNYLTSATINGNGLGSMAIKNVPASLADTTYVMFARTDFGRDAALVAYLVTANSRAPANVNTSEVTQVLIANIGGSSGIGGGDIIIL